MPFWKQLFSFLKSFHLNSNPSGTSKLNFFHAVHLFQESLQCVFNSGRGRLIVYDTLDGLFHAVVRLSPKHQTPFHLLKPRKTVASCSPLTVSAVFQPIFLFDIDLGRSRRNVKHFSTSPIHWQWPLWTSNCDGEAGFGPFQNRKVGPGEALVDHLRSILVLLAVICAPTNALQILFECLGSYWLLC